MVREAGSYSPDIILETKERTLPLGEEDNLINMGLCMRPLEDRACGSSACEEENSE